MMQVLRVVSTNSKNLISTLSILCLLLAAQNTSWATVDLDYFESKVRDSDKIILSWGTSSETMNLAFKILVSRDGYNYSEAVSLAGFGTTTEPQSYQYTYENALPGRTYFKLIQVNENLRSTELDKLYAVIGRDDISLIIAPNPVFSIMSIDTDFPLTTQIRVFNTAGQMVKTVAPQNAQSIHMGDLPRGLYLVVTEYGTKKVQVTK